MSSRRGRLSNPMTSPVGRPSNRKSFELRPSSDEGAGELPTWDRGWCGGSYFLTRAYLWRRGSQMPRDIPTLETRRGKVVKDKTQGLVSFATAIMSYYDVDAILTEAEVRNPLIFTLAQL